MQLTWFSAMTQECYLAAVWQLARHYHRSPDQLTEENLPQYFLHPANVKKVARATATIALCGIKFFYEQTLGRQWTTLRIDHRSLTLPSTGAGLASVPVEPIVRVLQSIFALQQKQRKSQRHAYCEHRHEGNPQMRDFQPPAFDYNKNQDYYSGHQDVIPSEGRDIRGKCLPNK